jgi:uncharacterized protein YjbI with pentapeptide repeats
VKGFKFPLQDKNIDWIKLTNKTLVKDTKYENLSVINLNLKESLAGNIKIDCGRMDHVNLNGSRMEKLQLNDVIFTECNLANSEAFQSFWLRTQIHNSKLTGLKVNSATMEEILIKDSNSQYLQMRFGKAKHLYFESCNLKGSDFQNTDLSECKFINCDLSDTEFSGCKLIGTDLRGSNLENIRLGVNEIKGAIVNTSQALFLSGILGIDIRD